MPVDWRALDADEREAQMNPRMAVGNDRAEARLSDYAERSRATRQRLPATYDIRYGDGPKATLDVFTPPGPGPHPIFAFVHGGYWRALDKDDHSFVVAPAVAAGFAGLVLNYDLCPAVTLDDILAELRAFMRWLARDGAQHGLDLDRLTMAGHSAGAHLTAMLMHDPGGRDLPPVRWAGLLSGIYEPEAILDISINEDVRLDAEAAARHDALRRPPRGEPRIEVIVGGDEPPAWIGQSEAYATMVRALGHDVAFRIVEGADHFTLLDHPIVPSLQHRP